MYAIPEVGEPWEIGSPHTALQQVKILIQKGYTVDEAFGIVGRAVVAAKPRVTSPVV
ncbi:hypothetical protein FRUB_10269 [Fimbriiglobus ruber]|uniref:Uncharacterized protein n=2 Tax=Fimbriiglobus ruber TaxID=1908690 RepID=A0A225D6Y6_9BACT|nr:hypothetical protein FRUB_10269 [Fimbriiglobus ruber]